MTTGDSIYRRAMVGRRSTISRRGARRLLEGAPASNAGEQRVFEVLDALTRPVTQADEPKVPAGILAAFADQATNTNSNTAGAQHAPIGHRRTGSRTRRTHAALALKLTAGVLAFSSGAVAAAAADVLPAPAQRAAHSLLGGFGIPAPPPPKPHTGTGNQPGGANGNRNGAGSPSSNSPSAHPSTGAHGGWPTAWPSFSFPANKSSCLNSDAEHVGAHGCGGPWSTPSLPMFPSTGAPNPGGGHTPGGPKNPHATATSQGGHGGH